MQPLTRQNIVISGNSPSHGERDSARPIVGICGLYWAMPPVGSTGKASGQVVRGEAFSEAESNLKIKWVILSSKFYNLTFWCFQVLRSLLLTLYKSIPLTQKHIIRGKTNLFESCFGSGSFMFEVLSVAFGALAPMPSLFSPLYTAYRQRPNDIHK